jgi:hypothetical protein
LAGRWITPLRGWYRFKNRIRPGPFRTMPGRIIELFKNFGFGRRKDATKIAGGGVL